MTTIDEFEYRQRNLADKKIKLFNPDDRDFTVNYHGKPVTIHALEIEEFDYHVGQHIKKHLVKHLLGKADKIIATDEEIKEVEQKVEVSYD